MVDAEIREKKRRERPKVSDKYEILGKIGEGTYGVVYKGNDKQASARNRTTPSHSRDARGDLVAIKKFKLSRKGEGVECRELTLLSELKHENVMELRDKLVYPEQMALYLVFDYAAYDLNEIIKYHRDVRKDKPCEFTIKSILWQVLNGIHYLHSNWIIHRDIKPSNILVMGDGVVKIADFGLARIFQSPLRQLSDNGVVVTIWYRAPELILGAKHYTKAIDMWAIGCIFAELITVMPLFRGSEVKDTPQAFQADQLQRIFAIMGTPTKTTWSDVHKLPEWGKVESWAPKPNIFLSAMAPHAQLLGASGLDLLSQLLTMDPSQRITAEQALQHKYFQESPLPQVDSLHSHSHSAVCYPHRPVQNVRPGEADPVSGSVHSDARQRTAKLARR